MVIGTGILSDPQLRQEATNVASYIYNNAKCDQVFTEHATELAALRNQVDPALSFELPDFAQWFHVETIIRDVQENIHGKGTSEELFKSAVQALQADLEAYEDGEDEATHAYCCQLYHSRYLGKEFLHPTPLSARNSALWRFVATYIEKATEKCARIAIDLQYPTKPPGFNPVTGVDYSAR